ncbi:MAG: D-tyrosyl-tRNA(Tyr) deacylase [Deltaproteobacteria bacterium]|nr:D-tyrosyl-tRNA(Tyr) deacylase [Deltaproteobacteria bacterium]
MRAVVQRVRAAWVEVADERVGEIGRGLVAFVGAGQGDGERDLEYVADKLVGLRIFPDEAGKMNRTVREAGGAVLLVSQFTVYGDVRRGRRPSFAAAMAPEQARETFASFVQLVASRGAAVATGRFAADMRVLCDNDGPVKRRRSRSVSEKACSKWSKLSKSLTLL